MLHHATWSGLTYTSIGRLHNIQSKALVIVGIGPNALPAVRLMIALLHET